MELIQCNDILLPASRADVIRHNYLSKFLGLAPDTTDKIVTLNQMLNIFNNEQDFNDGDDLKTVVLFGIGDGYVDTEPADLYSFHLKNILPIFATPAIAGRIIQNDGSYGLRTSEVRNQSTYEIGYLKKVDIVKFKDVDNFDDNTKVNVLQCTVKITKAELDAYFAYIADPSKNYFNEITLYFGTKYTYRDPKNKTIIQTDYINVVPFHREVFVNKSISTFTDTEFIFNVVTG